MTSDADPLRPPDGRGPPPEAALAHAGTTLGGADLDSALRPALRHWPQSPVTEPGLDHRGNIYFAAVEMTRMPMVLADPNQPDTPIVFANNAFLDLTGYELEDILGRNCRFLQGADTDPDTVRMFREATARREALAVEVLNYRRDGTPFWNGIFISPVFDGAGELIYFFASQLDVSRRRESEQALRQSQKMESIGQLTAGLAHDFNNLLQVIAGSLERLQARGDDPRTFERYVAAARTATERAARLTGQLLAFARRSRLEPRPVEVTELIGSISELLDASAGAGVALQLHLHRRLPQVRVDPVHLEMALIDLVVNARDASPEGGTITVAASEVRLGQGEAAALGLASGDYVVLCVSDEGVGMPAHVKARATEPFFTTKGPGKGTGLGLAMAQGFVQQSGGGLAIDSEPGQGATIKLYFPVTGPSPEAAASRFRAQPVGGGEAPAPRILLVEDSPEVAGFARAALTESGYRVLAAHGAEEGARLFEAAAAEGGVQLVVCDGVMAGGASGQVFADEIRARDAAVPILLTTGYDEHGALSGPRSQDMDVLGKPYRRSELIDRVQAAPRRGVRTGPGRETSDCGPARS